MIRVLHPGLRDAIILMMGTSDRKCYFISEHLYPPVIDDNDVQEQILAIMSCEVISP